MQKNMIRQNALLFAGTAIGAGMLALPIATGACGFAPSVAFITFWFIYSVLTMLILLECMGYQKNDAEAGFISVSEQFSGPLGKMAVRIGFVLVLFSVTTGYIIGSGQLLHNVFSMLSVPLSVPLCSTLFTLFFSFIALQHFSLVGKINQWFMFLLIGSFLLMIFTLSQNFQIASLIQWKNPMVLLPTSTIVVLSFSCHNLLPTILNHAHNNMRSLRRSIFIGMSIPLVIYILWNMIIMGTLPQQGSGSISDIILHQAEHGGELAMLAQSLESASPNTQILGKLFMAFGLSAIITSYLGVVLSLKDFLIQALHLGSYKRRDIISMGLIAIPGLLFGLYIPHGFSMVLHYAGLILTYIFGIAPLLWIYKARYNMRLVSRYPSGLSLITLSVVGLLSLLLVGLQCVPSFYTALTEDSKTEHSRSAQES